ncbi:MAG: M15 family metallopeptidase [Flavobacteriales bacterium]
MPSFLALFSVLVLMIFNACEPPKTSHSSFEKINQAPQKQVVIQPISYHFSKEQLLGKIDPKTNSDFVLADSEFCSKSMYLHKDCAAAFRLMYDSAKTDAINLHIISGTRNFDYQKGIWNRKWNKYKHLEGKQRVGKILEYSAMPGASRHHWGTDIDLNSLNNSYFEKGEGLRIYQWLQKHAQDFGFYQVYGSKSNGRQGYEEEKWHWSYLPVAKRYLEAYKKNIKHSDLKGFNGSEFAKELQLIPRFVLGIDKPENN